MGRTKVFFVAAGLVVGTVVGPAVAVAGSATASTHGASSAAITIAADVTDGYRGEVVVLAGRVSPGTPGDRVLVQVRDEHGRWIETGENARLRPTSTYRVSVGLWYAVDGVQTMRVAVTSRRSGQAPVATPHSAGVAVTVEPYPSPTPWQSMSVGAATGCGINQAQRLWCWGFAEGTGTGRTDVDGIIARLVGRSDWTDVSVGGFGAVPVTCAVRADSTMWCWGENRDGAVGAPASVQAVYVPRQVGSATGWTSVSVGPDAACGIRDGELWCWGRDGIHPDDVHGGALPVYAPERVGALDDWVSVTVNQWHSCGVHADGTASCWGLYLGRGPVPASGWVQLDFSQDDQLCGVQADGTVWCGDTERLQRVPIDDVLRMSGSTDHQCAIKSDGTLWCWGDNSRGQLGLGNTRSSSVPLQVGTEVDWQDVTAGEAYTCGVRSDGSAWCWGNNQYRRLSQFLPYRNHREARFWKVPREVETVAKFANTYGT